ncbi:head GIN domain-containing protein [Erythrobacter sp. F6033]|uniref:head GIN domain-containing protein n=1 Tax=Erythrobacter sp. F6033 TaxID=2926401 RepID=UPI001FF5A0D0|nr:head GIN domain-containing protein [Erythrobacter sp. F6033]MCK0129762.1 DUF2807 domain-containing protein [Erythrobacter sp. F6033]
MIERILKGLAPLAALAMGATLSGCGNIDMKINGEEGVPLAELDTANAAPTEVVVATNATVILTEGDGLEISVENDPETALRFTLDENTLGVTSDPDLEIKDGAAIVRVTMPAPENIVIAGSGSVETAALSANPELVIGGSGSIVMNSITTETLEISIGGSGDIKGSGTTDRLEVTIGGSGNVDLAGLKATNAEVSIGGSGSVSFASDGEVEANIAGAGDVNVTGNAKCTLNSFGSGSLNCTPTSADTEAEAEPVALEES